MKAFLDKFFSMPKDEKISKRVFDTKITLSILSILLCMAAMISSAYAWFATGVSSGDNVLATQRLSVLVTGEDGAVIEPVENASYSLSPGTYTVALRPRDSTAAGYCIVETTGNLEQTKAAIRDSSQLKDAEIAVWDQVNPVLMSVKQLAENEATTDEALSAAIVEARTYLEGLNLTAALSYPYSAPGAYYARWDENNSFTLTIGGTGAVTISLTPCWWGGSGPDSSLTPLVPDTDTLSQDEAEEPQEGMIRTYEYSFDPTEIIQKALADLDGMTPKESAEDSAEETTEAEAAGSDETEIVESPQDGSTPN